MQVPVRLALIAVTASLWAGCGTSDDQSAVRDVAERFHLAVDEQQGDTACDQLSDATLEQLESQTGQACGDAVTRLELDGGAVVSVAVYMTTAKVDLGSGESAFLSLEPEGWRLSAIGCRPEAGEPRDVPFDCEAEA